MAPYIGNNGANFPHGAHSVNSGDQLPFNTSNNAPPNVNGNTVQPNVNLQYGGNVINEQTYYQRHRRNQTNSYSTPDIRVPNLPYHHTLNQLTGGQNTSMQVTPGNPSPRSLYSQQQLVELFSDVKFIITFTSSTYFRPRRLELSALLGIPEEKIKIWFQNRRMKTKKENPKPNPENIPSIGKLQPTIGQPQPTIEQPQPTIEQPQPTIGQPQPTIGQPQPTIGQPQPTIRQPQPTIGQPQLSIGESQLLKTHQNIRVNLLSLEPSSGGKGSERPINSFPDRALQQIQNNMVKFSEPIGQFVTSPGSYSPSLAPSEVPIYYQNINNNYQMQNTSTDQNNYGMANAYSGLIICRTRIISNNSFRRNIIQINSTISLSTIIKTIIKTTPTTIIPTTIIIIIKILFTIRKTLIQGNPVVESHYYPTPPRGPEDVTNNSNVPLQGGPYSLNNFGTPPSGTNQK
ncbi:Homeobox protein Hox-A2b [Armadillidium vulgare]|nr:Homeobox protein Hox-A2b [Armadillidium vulgare]